MDEVDVSGQNRASSLAFPAASPSSQCLEKLQALNDAAKRIYAGEKHPFPPPIVALGSLLLKWEYPFLRFQRSKQGRVEAEVDDRLLGLVGRVEIGDIEKIFRGESVLIPSDLSSEVPYKTVEDEDGSLVRVPKRRALTLCVLRKENQESMAAFSSLKRTVMTAGLKDKRAVTYQFVTLAGMVKLPVRSRGVCAYPVAPADRHLNPGDLSSNAFTIVLRDVEGDVGSVPSSLTFANYFGHQRTGTEDDPGASWRIGRALLAGDYDAVVAAIFPVSSKKKDIVKRLRRSSPLLRAARILQKNAKPSEAIDAVPHKLRQLWLHAYQSRLFNIALAAALAESPETVPDELPLVGADEATLDTLRKDELCLEDLERAGLNSFSKRMSMATATELTCVRQSDTVVRVSFRLPPGAFATVFLKSICDELITERGDDAFTATTTTEDEVSRKKQKACSV